jgi:ATP-dependent DNA helicase RecG
MAVVIVQPALAPPVRVQGRTWIRVGPRRALATPEEEKRLAERRRASDLPFELQPIRAADLDDLDLDLFHRVYLPAAVAPEALAGNRRSTEEQLQALRFADGELHPTVLGLLVVGKDPRRFVPGAYVQFLRIDGNDLGDPIRDQKEIGGPLPELLRLLDEVLEVNISTAISITSAPTEIRQPDYPMAALQQLARNAVMHRAYEGTHAQVLIYWFRDRVEIHSPGGPFGGVSRENFGQPGVTDYRNLNLAAAMKALGYVQNFGVGIPTARRALAANGNPPPEFQIQPAHVLAILRRRP